MSEEEREKLKRELGDPKIKRHKLKYIEEEIWVISPNLGAYKVK